MARSADSKPVRNGRSWPVGIAVVAFAVLDVALVALAFGAVNAPIAASAPTSTAWMDESPVPTASPTPVPAMAPTVAPTRILAALNSEVAWRSTTGSCPEAEAQPELSTDAGATWQPTDASGPTGVTALQSIDISSSALASFIGFDASDCSPQYVRTFVGGDNYSTYNDEIEGSWYFVPNGALHAPGADVATPCESIVSLASRSDDEAAALCADGSVHITADRATSWVDAPARESTLAIADIDGGYVLALAGSLECAGVQLVFVDRLGETVTKGCQPLETEAADLAGTVAIAATDGTVWLWAGDVVAQSSDRGLSWSRR